MKIKLYRLWSLGIFLSLLFFTTASADDATDNFPSLTSINASNASSNHTLVSFSFSKDLATADVQTFLMKTIPPRIVFDFKGVKDGLQKDQQEIDMGVVRNVQVAESQGRVRAVLTLLQEQPYSWHVKGNVINVMLSNSTEQAVHAQKNAVSSSSAVVDNTKHHSIADVDFKRGSQGGGQLIVSLSDPNTEVDVKRQGTALVADFINTEIPKRLLRQLDVTDFGTPVQTVDIVNKGDDVEMIVQAKGDYDHFAYQINNKFVFDVKEKLPTAAPGATQTTYKGDRLSLNFQDIKVRAVLQLLAEFTGLNIVVSDSVQGSMTLRLNNVPWDQALDIILKTQGLEKRQFGNVILIGSAAEITAREQQELKAMQQIQDLSPLQSQLITIRYAKAKEIADLLKAKDNSLLSARGNVSVDERTNTVWVQDTADKINQIQDLIMRLDVPVKQVLIETRVVVVDKQSLEELGVRFGVTHANSLSGTLDGANTMNINGGNAAAASVASRLNFDNPAASAGAAHVGLALARIAKSTYLDLELSALESEHLAQIVASPRLVTSDQQKAHIQQGVEIPYQTASASGATTIEFRKALLKLDVTPQITPDNKINLDLLVTQDTKGELIFPGGPPAINTREIGTKLMVDNGETLVLGGIYEQTKTNDVKRVPFLSDIPLLGNLFKYRKDDNQRRELLIFVTPKIVQSGNG